MRAAFAALKFFCKKIAIRVRVFSVSRTYISKGFFRKERRGGSDDMYDTAKRAALVKERVREHDRRRRRNTARELGTGCLLLFAALIKAAGLASGPGQAAAQGAFGAMLLREDAGGYVLLGVASFTAAVVLTAVCIRLREREKRKTGRAGKPAPQKQEEKTA